MKVKEYFRLFWHRFVKPHFSRIGGIFFFLFCTEPGNNALQPSSGRPFAPIAKGNLSRTSLCAAVFYN